MRECNSLEKANRSLLANPEHGQAYLKAALEVGDEREFLSALRTVMDSMIEAELNHDSAVRVLATWEKAQAA